MSEIKLVKLKTIDNGYVYFRMDQFESLEYFGPESGVNDPSRWLLCSTSGVNYHLDNHEGDRLSKFIESGSDLSCYELAINNKTI